MRIALLDSGTTFGDVQRFLCECALGLLARGWEVLVVLSTDGPCAHWCVDHGLPVEIVPFPPWALADATPSLLRFGRRTIIALARLFRARHMTHVMAWSPSAAVLGGCAARLVGACGIWRALAAVDFAHPTTAQLALHLMHQAHVPPWVPVADLPAQLAAKVRPIPLGIDAGGCTVRPPTPRRRKEPLVIGMAGAWHPYAGQDVLVKAYRILRDNGRHAHLRLAGVADTPEAARYRDLVQGAVKAAGMSAWVAMEERGGDYTAFYAQCDIVVAPALTITPGRLVLEAMAAGRPVVGARVDALSEYIADSRSGLLAPPGDPRALADALEILLASPALRAAMGKHARTRVLDRYPLVRMLEQTETALSARLPAQMHLLR